MKKARREAGFYFAESVESAVEMLAFLALLAHRTDQGDDLRHVQVAVVGNQGTAQAAAAGIQLAHAARHDVHEDIRVANLFIGSFAKFSVHGFISSNRVAQHKGHAAEGNEKIPFKLVLLSGIFS